MKVTKTKLYMAGISISLAMALTACGGESTGTESIQTASTSLSKSINLETRNGTTDENPINLKIVEENEENITLSFDGFHNAVAFEQANGVALSYAKIPDSYSDDYNISAENPLSVPDDIWQKVHHGWHIKTLASDTDANRTQITVTELDPNQRYAFRIASMVTHEGLFGEPPVELNTGITLYSGTGDWSEITAQGKTLEASPLWLPCVEGKVACLYDETTCDWFYGANVDWCLPKGLTHVNLYKEMLDEDNNTVPGTFETLATELTGEPTEYNDKDVEEGSTYRYTVEAYYIDDVTTEKVYSDENATIDLFVTPYVAP